MRKKNQEKYLNKHEKRGKPRTEKRFSEWWHMHGIRHISGQCIMKPERDPLGHNQNPFKLDRLKSTCFRNKSKLDLIG